MKLPTIQGVIRRRILANYRVDPAVMQRHLPARFRPKCGAFPARHGGTRPTENGAKLPGGHA